MPETDFLAAGLLLAATLSAWLGMAWLALAMDVHWEQVHDAAPVTQGRVRALRILGSLALAISLGLCLKADHASMAFLVWIMVLAAAVFTVAMTLSWRPAWLRIVPVGPVGGAE